MPEENARRVLRLTAARRVAAMAERWRNILLVMESSGEGDNTEKAELGSHLEALGRSCSMQEYAKASEHVSFRPPVFLLSFLRCNCVLLSSLGCFHTHETDHSPSGPVN